jgi:hypothetical protein
MPLSLAYLTCEVDRIAGQVTISFQDDYIEKLERLKL